MASRFLFMMVLLLGVTAPAQQTGLASAVRWMLQASGAGVPLSVTVAHRRVTGTPELLVTRAALSDRLLILSVRCRLRAQCGDVIATAQYDTHEAANEACRKLAETNTPKEKPSVIIGAGERVKLVIQTRTLRLELPVKALNSGAMQQTVRVRDLKTRKIYSAVVVGPKEVRLML
jgi:hypothetical protein